MTLEELEINNGKGVVMTVGHTEKVKGGGNDNCCIHYKMFQACQSGHVKI